MAFVMNDGLNIFNNGELWHVLCRTVTLWPLSLHPDLVAVIVSGAPYMLLFRIYLWGHLFLVLPPLLDLQLPEDRDWICAVHRGISKP